MITEDIEFTASYFCPIGGHCLEVKACCFPVKINPSGELDMLDLRGLAIKFLSKNKLRQEAYVLVESDSTRFVGDRILISPKYYYY